MSVPRKTLDGFTLFELSGISQLQGLAEHEHTVLGHCLNGLDSMRDWLQVPRAGTNRGLELHAAAARIRTSRNEAMFITRASVSDLIHAGFGTLVPIAR